MRPKTRFLKMFYKLPEKSRMLTWKPYGNKPMTLNVIVFEVRGNTKLGKKCLKGLGFVE